LLRQPDDGSSVVGRPASTGLRDRPSSHGVLIGVSSPAAGAIQHKLGAGISQCDRGHGSGRSSARSPAEHAAAPSCAGSRRRRELTPIKTPWLLGPIAQTGRSWDVPTRDERHLAGATSRKAHPQAGGEDYNEHGLQSCFPARGSTYDLIIEVSRACRIRCTGWPGGTPRRPRRDGSRTCFPSAHRVQPASGRRRDSMAAR